jgi:hypothetical protein
MEKGALQKKEIQPLSKKASNAFMRRNEQEEEKGDRSKYKME